MPFYFKILEVFIFKVLFNKDEYNFTKRGFKPFKVLVMLLLSLNVPFTFLLLERFNVLHDIIQYHCPPMLDLVSKGHTIETINAHPERYAGICKKEPDGRQNVPTINSSNAYPQDKRPR